MSRQPRLCDSKILFQRAQNNLTGLNDGDFGDARGNLADRDMNGQRHHPKATACQHHHRPVALGDLGEIFGMPREFEAALQQRRLVNRRGDNGARRALHRHGHRCVDSVHHRMRVRRIGMSQPQRRAKRVAVDQCRLWNIAQRAQYARVADQLQYAFADAPAQRVPRGDGDFRPDTGRLAHGDEDGCVRWRGIFTLARHRRICAGPAADPAFQCRHRGAGPADIGATTPPCAVRTIAARRRRARAF